jgi:chromosome segregation ATPase
MGTQARVTATDAFEGLRLNLIAFVAKARRSVEDADNDVRRTRNWLQHDQRVHWEEEVRRRTKAVDQAQQELRSTQFTSAHAAALIPRQKALEKAKQELSEAQAKLTRVKKWNQTFDYTAEPILKRLEEIRDFIEGDLPHAVTYLSTVQLILAEEGGVVAGVTDPPTTKLTSTLPEKEKNS